MARKSNDLFIGADKINTEGRTIKHPALIKLYATINLNKISDDPIGIISLDLETNANDGTLMLLGFYDGVKYYPYYKAEFVGVLFSWVKMAYKTGKALTYWNKLDPFIIYKQFLQYVSDPNEIKLSMSKFSKVSGEWNKDLGKWDIKPIVEIRMKGGLYFGIKNAIRSNIQFYFRREHDDDIKTVWAYDIAQLYQHGLERTALGRFDKATNTYPNARLPYYTKGEQDLHIVNWTRFDDDLSYQKRVLNSNTLDSRAVYDLAYQIQEEFKTAFEFYPKTLISQGSIARAGIVATLSKIHDGDRIKIADDVRSIGITNYEDIWHEKYGEDTVKDLLCLMYEAYSGGQIEAYMYGFTSVAYTTDLTQAYPYHIQHLWDLRNATITHGTGLPPHIPNSYCLIRGDVYIPRGVDYHPLTIKHPMPTLRETNIRGIGYYRASYYLEERDFLVSLGATFSNEEWYNIETTGQLSPLATVCKVFTDLRAKLQPSGKDYIAKISSASLYGILFEAVDTWIEYNRRSKIDVSHDDRYYKELLSKYKKHINLSSIRHAMTSGIMSMWHNKDSKMYPDMIKQELEQFGLYLKHDHPYEIMREIDFLYRQPTKIKEYVIEDITEVQKDGYRGGEFLNPLYAGIITMKTRLQVSKTANDIKRRGGNPILIMTDSLFWKGTADMIDPAMIRETKTVGYFEKVTKINDFLCLGSGRYGFTYDDGFMQSKKRGINAVDIHDPEGIIIDDFNWMNGLKVMQRIKTDKLQVKVRKLVSVGLVAHTSILDNVIIEGKDEPEPIKLSYKDLGRVVDVISEVDIIVGKSKRLYDDNIKDPYLLATQLIPTEPIYVSQGMFGDNKINDQTLPELRRLLMLKHMTTRKEKRKGYQKTATTNYYNKNNDKIKEFRKQNYEYLKEYGYDSKERNKMQCWSLDKIQMKLLKDGKI